MISFKLFFEKTRPLGLVETIHFKDIGSVESKVDSGNGAYNVLHGINIEQGPNDTVSFTTINDKILKKKVAEYIDINIGSGVIETRPVVLFDIEIGDHRFNDVPFSIGDRAENEYKILIGKDFIEQLGGIIDITKSNNLD